MRGDDVGGLSDDIRRLRRDVSRLWLGRGGLILPYLPGDGSYDQADARADGCTVATETIVVIAARYAADESAEHCASERVGAEKLSLRGQSSSNCQSDKK